MPSLQWENQHGKGAREFFKGILKAVPNLSGTRDQFHGRQFSHRLGWVDGFGMIQKHLFKRTSCCAAQSLTGLMGTGQQPGGWGHLP